MEASPRRTRHLIFVAHLLACMPFLVMWVMVPSTHDKIPAASFQRIQTFIAVIVAYLLLRTYLAFKDPPKLHWEYVFPPIDVAIVSILIGLGNRDPLSNIALLYLFPLAQAAGTLNLRWSVAVAAMVLLGAALATHGLQSSEPFNAFFRYFFIFVLASLITMLAQASAKLREQIGVTRDRNHMAMEIHDGVQAHLMTLSKQLELAEHVALQSPQRAKEIAAEGQETARLAADELRYLVKRMRSQSLHGGFIPALQNFVHNLTSRHGLTSSIQVLGDDQIAPVDIEHTAFRISQESLTNIVRHANASHVDLTVTYTRDSLELSIQDNGDGFEMPAECEGLDGMKSRAGQAGGKLTITSELGKGTHVVAILPRKKS